MEMPTFITDIFGGKNPLKSLTAWGLVIYATATAASSAACSNGLLSFETCETLEGFVATVGVVLAGLGIRKASPAKNVA